jgi:hypothetical protein
VRAIAIVLVCLQLSACAGAPPARGCDPAPVPERVDQVNSATGGRLIAGILMLLGIVTARTAPSCRADVRLP